MTFDAPLTGHDAHRAGRPVVLCAALGVAAFALTFAIALALGRGLAGSALAALLLPLALSGALAVGLAVGFLVAVVVEQPYGLRRMSRIVPVAAPLAALTALFVYAADPATHVGAPPRPEVPTGTEGAAPPPRTVSVAPPATPVTPATPGTPAPLRPVAVAAPVPGPAAPVVAAPGPVAPPRVTLGPPAPGRGVASVGKGGKKAKLRRCGARRRGFCLGRH